MAPRQSGDKPGETTLELRCTLATCSDGQIRIDAVATETSAIATRSTILARGQQKALRDPECAAAFDSWHDALRGDSPYDPTAFCSVRGAADAADRWGGALFDLLEQAIGTDAIDDVLEMFARASHRRLVIDPLDAAVAALPFEALRWRNGGFAVTSENLLLSVVRLPIRLEAHSRSGGHTWAGRYRTVAVYADAPGEPPCFDAFNAKLPPITWEHGPLSITRPAVSELVKPEDLGVVLATEHPDLLVVTGHGAAGMQKGRPPLTSGRLAGLLRGAGGPGHPLTAVVLALCNSANAGREASGALGEALTEAACRTGVPVAIGFHGSPAAESTARFLSVLLSSIHADVQQAMVRGEEPIVSLLGWERGVAAARRELDAAPYLATTTVHPNLLMEGHLAIAQSSANRTDTADAVTATARRRGRRAVHERTISATPFYVPGHVLFARDTDSSGSGFVRVPVPTDTGARLVVRFREGTGVTRTAHGSAIDDEDGLLDLVRQVVSKWPALQGLEIDLATADGVAVRRWANNSAELSAFVRAAWTLLGEEPPQLVRQILADQVAKELGALDAAPRAYVVRGDVRPIGRAGPQSPGRGRRRGSAYIRRYEAWPPLDVITPDDPFPGFDETTIDYLAHDDTSWVPGCAEERFEDVLRSADTLIGFASTHAPIFARNPLSRLNRIRGAVASYFARTGGIVIPAAARLVPSTDADRRAPRLRRIPALAGRTIDAEAADEFAF